MASAASCIHGVRPRRDGPAGGGAAAVVNVTRVLRDERLGWECTGGTVMKKEKRKKKFRCIS